MSAARRPWRIRLRHRLTRWLPAEPTDEINGACHRYTEPVDEPNESRRDTEPTA